MKNYFNRYDRDQHILMLVFHQITGEWLEKCKRLTKEERRCIKTGLTWIKKGCDSMTIRSSDDYMRAMKNAVMHSHLFIEDDTGKILKERVDTKTIALDDFYELANSALNYCSTCTKKDHENCKDYQMFMRLGVPICTEDTEECPYR